MTSKLSALDVHDFYKRYEAGETTVDLARIVGVGPGSINDWFRRNGLAIRSESDARRLAAARQSPEERLARTWNAHAALRGISPDFEQMCNRARGVERVNRLTILERRFAKFLRKHSVTFKTQVAIGPYNADFVVGFTKVTVEIFGGSWHSCGRHAARFQQRTHYLLDNGWSQLVLWIMHKRTDRVFRSALKELRSMCDLVSRHPSRLREHRVIWSDGELVAVERRDIDNFTLKPTFEVERNPVTGRYQRVA